jgi:hypothetical protein
MRKALLTTLTAATFLACVASAQEAASRKYVTPEEFKRLVGEAEYARLLAEAAQRQATEEAYLIEREGSIVRFRGSISRVSATSLAQVLADTDVEEIWVESDGGDVEAGQEMGRLIRDRALRVVVTGACISSCANYLFTAGKTRVIRPGAFVVWHGSTFQKDGREFDQCGRTRSSLDGLSWTQEEIRDRKTDSEGVARRQREDASFFASIGIDEYITRVGQEPRFIGNFTLSPSDMALFGVVGVEAPVNYGTAAFCSSVNAKRPTLRLHCVEVTPRMLAYERARRALGEICNPDGTLTIAVSSAKAAESD